MTAAERALARGAPETAATYLARSPSEPLYDDERATMVMRLGQAEARIDPACAADHLRQALEQPGAPESTCATAALELGRLLTVTGRTAEAVAVLGRVADELVDGAPELATRLEAELCRWDASTSSCGRWCRGGHGAWWPVEGAAMSCSLTPRSPGARGHVERRLGGRGGGALAECALASDRLREEGLAGGTMFFYLVLFLTIAERFDSAVRKLDRAIEEARQAGSVVASVTASVQRSLLGYRRGTLTEAEADARGALEAARLNGLRSLELMAVTALSDVVIERGEGELAVRELADTPIDEAARESPQGNMALEARGRLRLALGETEAAVADLTEAW